MPGRVAHPRLADPRVRPLAVRPKAGINRDKLVAAVLEQRDRVRHYLGVRRLDRLMVEDEMGRRVRVCDLVVERLGRRRRGAVCIIRVIRPQEDLCERRCQRRSEAEYEVKVTDSCSRGCRGLRTGCR